MDRQSIASSRGAGAPLCVEKRNQLCLFKKTATRSPSLFIARTFWAGVAGTALDMAKIEMERKRTEKEKVFFLFFASRSNGERASKRGGESDEEEKNEKHQKNRFEKFFGTFFSLSLSLFSLLVFPKSSVEIHGRFFFGDHLLQCILQQALTRGESQKNRVREIASKKSSDGFFQFHLWNSTGGETSAFLAGHPATVVGD